MLLGYKLGTLQYQSLKEIIHLKREKNRILISPSKKKEEALHVLFVFFFLLDSSFKKSVNDKMYILLDLSKDYFSKNEN